MPEDESHSAQIVDPASDSANTVESADAPGDDAAMPEDESLSAQIVDPASDSANTVEYAPGDEASEDVSSPTAVEDEATTASNVQADDAPAQPSAEPAPAAADLSTESADEPDAGAVS